MRVLWLLIPLVLSACVVTTRPVPVSPSPVTPAPQPAPSVTVNSRIGLPAYPGSRILRRDEERDGGSRVDFESGDALERVYGFFHNELSIRGWQRTRLESKGAATKLEANYQRGGVGMKLELDQQGRSGRYRLEIEF